MQSPAAERGSAEAPASAYPHQGTQPKFSVQIEPSIPHNAAPSKHASQHFSSRFAFSVLSASLQVLTIETQTPSGGTPDGHVVMNGLQKFTANNPTPCPGACVCAAAGMPPSKSASTPVANQNFAWRFILLPPSVWLIPSTTEALHRALRCNGSVWALSSSESDGVRTVSGAGDEASCSSCPSW